MSPPPARYASPPRVQQQQKRASSISSPKRKQQQGGSTGKNNRVVVNNLEPRSPSREEESSIRRGAEIIRRQIQKQMVDMGERLRAASPVNNTPSAGAAADTNTTLLPGESAPAAETAPPPPRSVRNKDSGGHHRPWNEEKRLSWTPPVRKEVVAAVPSDKKNGGASSQLERKLEEIGDECTDFSDPWKNHRDATGKRLVPHLSSSTNSNRRVEVDPPARNDDDDDDAADWSLQYEDDDDDGGGRIDLAQAYGLIRTESHPPNQELQLPAGTGATTATPAAPPSSTRRKPKATPPESGFLSSDDDDDDNSDDIVEVKEPMFDHFYEQDLLPVEKTVKSSVKKQSFKSPLSIKSPLGCSFVDSIFTYQEGGQAVDSIFTYQEGDQAIVVSPPERQPPPDSSSSGSSSGQMYPQLNPAGEYEEAEHSRVVQMTHDKEVMSYRLPLNLETPESKIGPMKVPQPSLIDYDDDDDGSDEHYVSPVKQPRPVSEVPLRSPGTVSQLSTPGKSLKAKSSALMKQYEELLRDPAYLHAQNAGFLWQSIVGQHIRFPSRWWNGARGPPIGEDGLPWIFFGRHTVKRNRVLNQLVKGRASAGRLLLHVVIQDLVTRTPVQDIAIGCFHPNAKGIRQGESALKRFEDCRDVWMAIRKRSRKSVVATDSLLYSQSNWDGNHSMCRSPLGPGQRVNNTNVRSVFGEKAPLETIFLSEDELYERLSTQIMRPTVDGAVSPPMAILEEFVFA